MEIDQYFTEQRRQWLSGSAEQYFRSIFIELCKRGSTVAPRGQKVIEIENFAYRLPPYVRFCNFECRKLNINYIKKEFLWYLRGNKFDTSICDEASMWKNLVNGDGSINSNYGQYVFGERSQFNDVIKTLREDRDSRRASIMILADHHLAMVTKDVPCTYALNFRIRENRVNMSVHMRSQDAIFGMGNDAPAFSFIHEMVFNALLENYPELSLGTYHHTADSFHVYERHFDMLGKISGFVDEDGKVWEGAGSPYIEIDCPRISGPDEVKYLRSVAIDVSNKDPVPESYKFTKWLLEEKPNVISAK